MALNYPGPYELRFFYDVNPAVGAVLTHQHRLNVALSADPDPGTPFADINAVGRVTVPSPLSTLCDAYSTLVKAIYNSATSEILYVELWKYTPDTFQSMYISSYDLNDAGTSAVALAVASQSIATFRTIEGGIMKVTFMETVHVPGMKIDYGGLGVPETAIVDYFLDDVASFFLARDTSYPVAFLHWFPGENEATFKQRFRQ